MQFSIGKLTALLVVLLMMATIATTGVGLHILQSNFRTLEDHRDSEARDTLSNAATAIRNQIRFYQGLLRLVATSPQVNDLLEFARPEDIVSWSEQVGRLVPGTLGTALTNPDGSVFGDPMALRIGAACAADIVARLGGDEFAVILTNIDQARLQDWLVELVDDHDRSITGLSRNQGCACQFSVGVASIDARVYATPVDVYSAADTAMYTIKQQRAMRTSRYAIAYPPHDATVGPAQG